MKHIKLFEEFEKSAQGTTEREVQDIVSKMNKSVKFNDVLKVEDREWLITGLSPDKTHGDLKVFYKDSESEPQRKVDFFDFHPDTYDELLKIVKKHVE